MKYLAGLLFFVVSMSTFAQEQFTVYFDFDIDEADYRSEKRLDAWIAQNKGAEILKIYGYADSIGNADYNIDLSQRRAVHVQEELAAAKANFFSQGLEVKGFGETRAFSANRSSDRIVVIHYRTADMKMEAPVVVQEVPVNIPPKELTETPAPNPSPTLIQPSVTEQVRVAKKGDKIILRGMNFHNNSDLPLNESHPMMKELLDIMNDNPNLKIDIQGHICCQKKETSDVSLRRAKAIHRFLQLNGIKSNRLSYQGFGSTRPIYPLPEKNEEERVANRRVEIEIIEQ
jgi:outer membrane protein OmpA-like peptidoglycan-associated protein